MNRLNTPYAGSVLTLAFHQIRSWTGLFNLTSAWQRVAFCVAVSCALAASGTAYGQVIDVGTSAEFEAAVQTINNNPDDNYTINLTSGFTMSAQVLNLTSNTFINFMGNGFTIDGDNLYQPLIIDSGLVSLDGLTIINQGSDVTINSGVLSAATDTFNGPITTNDQLIFSQTIPGSFNDVISGVGSVRISGEVTLGGMNTYSGGTIVDAGSLLIGTTDSLQGAIANDSGVTFDQFFSGTYAGDMSGAGLVTITGGGSVTFAGLNSYTGGTTVDAGNTLIGTTDSLQGNIASDGQVTFDQAITGTYGGDLSGSGSVLITGGGTITFSGMNSYTGGTTIDAGNTLIGTTDSLQGDIANDGAIQFDQASGGSYNGVISGGGTVQISNTGPVTLTGLNTYTGGTLIDSGSTLIGTTDSLQGDIANDGTLQFEQGGAGSYLGVISGSGVVQISGSSQVTFSGLNTYSGGTIVDAGATLIGTTDSLQGAFTNNGMVQFDQGGAGTYSGDMSGTGGVQISGGGIVTFTGLNTYSGGTIVDSGSTLIGTTDSLQGDFNNDGSVIFDAVSSGTYAGNMVGTGTVQISGGSEVTFSGSNSYSGGTTVDSGSTLIGSTGSLQGDIANDGLLRFSQSTIGSYNGVISGTGAVQIGGTGSVTFTGLNSYTGGTSISAGATLVGSTDSLQGDFDNDGTLKFLQNVDGTYAGVISGSGAVEITTTQEITFTGLNTYSGGTKVNGGGTLIGSTDSLQGNFNNNGKVVFDQATGGTYAGNMTGVGRVEITGGGPITFSGTNNYTGGTTVDASNTLIGTTSSLNGAFTNNGAVQFDQSTDGTYAGNMTGVGSVQISGGGAVTFSGVNSYTGGTTIDASTELAGTTNSLKGDFANSGLLTFDQSQAGTFAGVISGTGAVYITGGGPVTFTGANTYSGGTVIGGLTTLIGTTDSLQGNVLTDGILKFNQSTAGTFAGIIFGNGGVAISGTGPITLTGTNIYSGGTLIESGATLIGETTSVQGNMDNRGTVQFNQSTTGIYDGSMTGSGKVEITGGGTITFTGFNDYTGGTTVDSGNTLIGSTLNVQGNFLNNGAVNFDQGAAGTYSGNMSGTGSVQVSGVGPLTFSGTNSYTGGTTVNGLATLIGTTSSLTGDIDNSGTVKFIQNSNGSYAGNLTGTGSVFVGGTGGVTLSGVNAYTGGTTVDTTGKLFGSTDAVQGDIVNNGFVKFINDAGSLSSNTYSGDMSGTGRVEITGGGTTMFTGTNSYTGGTTVFASNSLIGNTDSLKGDFTNNGTVTFSQGTSGNYLGSMSGSGHVNITGGGSVAFGGVNTYTGGTTVDLGNSLTGTTSSLQGDILNNGSLIFSQIGNGDFVGNISGTGDVEVTGPGIVNWIGDNTFTGGLTVNAGAILMGSTSSLRGAIANSGLIAFNQTTAGTFGGVITGAGGVEIAGLAPVTFSAANTYTGNTTIDSGSKLIVAPTGSIAGAVNVFGTLMGEGSVGQTTVHAGGNIYPGTVGAPLTVNGNLSLLTGSSFSADINPQGADKVIVTGAANIQSGTTLNLFFSQGTYQVGAQYQLLKATGGLTGTFTSVVVPNNGQLVSFTETYGTDDLWITINANLVSGASTPNQLAVASVLDQASRTATGDFADAISQLTSAGPAGISKALNQVAGDIHASLGTVQMQSTTLQMQLLSNRLAGLNGPGIPQVASTQSRSAYRLVSQAGDTLGTQEPAAFQPDQQNWMTWAQGYGLGGFINGDGNAGASNYRLGGTLFGAERWLDQDTMFGLLGGYAGTSVSDRQAGSTAQINSYQAGVYELFRREYFYFSNVDAYGNNNYDVSRPLQFGTVNARANSKSDGNQWSHYSELGTTVVNDDVKFQPFLGAQFILLDQQSFMESGAGGFNTGSGTQSVNSFRGVVGGRVYTETVVNDMLVVPTLGARYQHEWGDGTPVIQSAMVGAPTSFYAVAGNQTGRDFGLFTAGATIYVNEQFTIFGMADAQFATGYSSVIGSAGLQYSW